MPLPRALQVLERVLRRCWYLIGLAALLVAGVGVYSLAQVSATPVSVDQAVERFRAAPDPGTSDPTTASPVAKATSSSSTSTIPHLSPASVVPPSPTTSTATTLVIRRPPAGVYVYDTDGGEQVSVLGGSRRYPSQTTRTILHGRGCSWTAQVIFLEEHREKYSGCTTDTTLDVVASDTVVSWFGRSQRNQLTCDPPMRHLNLGNAPGTALPFTCRDGSGSTFNGTTRELGTERFILNGQERTAWRVRIVTTVTGQIRGTVQVEEVIDQATGIPLHEERHDDVQQPTEVGIVRYTQQVTSTLASLTPRT